MNSPRIKLPGTDYDIGKLLKNHANYAWTGGQVLAVQSSHESIFK